MTSPHLTDIHLQVLTYLSLLGETTLDELSYVSELPESDCEAELMDMAVVGTAKWGNGPDAWVVTDAGRAEHATKVHDEMSRLGVEDDVRRAYGVLASATEDRDAVPEAAAQLASRMRRFAGYTHRLAAAAAGQGPESWERVVGQLHTDLAITLGESSPGPRSLQC
ncbi:hypothetical protein [Nocardioides gilvus]|uniref:hypothetical protein n=1 Tax=Nocardioides gilvus TaxID=1735589 RepID=UPI000D744DD1|nr:hypothetical protein [Nocardioides gilvus]